MRNFFQEMASLPKVEMEPEFIGYAPAEFLKAPVEYFEREGKNIKSGEIKYDDNGRVREDPSAVKDLPAWKNQEGKEIQVVSRRINVTKGKVGESGDPFYEYKILEKWPLWGCRPPSRLPRPNRMVPIFSSWSVSLVSVGRRKKTLA
jgi:hypothetical protein